MLEHLSLIIPNLDNVRSYLDAMHLEYIIIGPTTIGTLDPLAICIPPGFMRIGIRYKDDGIAINIRKDQWK